MEVIIVIIKNADWANRFNKEKNRLSKKKRRVHLFILPRFQSNIPTSFSKRRIPREQLPHCSTKIKDPGPVPDVVAMAIGQIHPLRVVRFFTCSTCYRNCVDGYVNDL